MANSKDVSEVNSVIVAILTAFKKKTLIPIAKVDQEYRDEAGERVPFAKLGYPKLVDFLKTVPGVEIIEMGNSHYINFWGTENSKHIAELTSGQRDRSKSNRHNSGYSKPQISSYVSRNRGPSLKVEKYILDHISSIMKRYSKGLSKQELSKKLKYEYGINDKMINLNEYLRALSKELIVKDKIVYRISSSKLDDSKSSGSSYYEQNNLARINNFGNNYQSKFDIYSAYDSSVTEDLDYNAPTDTEFDIVHEVKAVDCNYDTNINKKHQSLEYSQIDTSYQKIDLDQYTEYQDDSNNNTNSSNQREKILSRNKDYLLSVLNERVLFRLEKLIQKHPKGIWSIELPKIYEEEYKISLEWTKLGFHRFSDFAAHLSEIFHVVGPQLNGDFKLYNAKEPLPDEKPQEAPKKLTSASLFEIYGECDIDPVPTSVPAEFSQRLCPDDVITIQETVGQISVANFGLNGPVDNDKRLVEVEIVEVYSPSFFWIRSLKNKSKFEKMMTKLQNFYDKSYENYAVPIIMLERGLNIACVFYGKWHRGIIKRVDHDCKVTVMFYDYGTLDKYPPEQIFYLHRSFTALPAQAIPCGLYGIGPIKGDQWPRKVRERFMQWACDRFLWARIIEVDVEKNSMLVTLADTSNDEDFFIDDWLLERGLAVKRKMVRIRPKNFLYERYLQCQAMKKCTKTEVIRNQNTRLTPKNHQSLSSGSPLSRRLRLLEKLRNISSRAESDKVIKKFDTCPTCGTNIPRTDYYNSEVPVDKVTSWLNKHNINDSGQLEKSSKHFQNISLGFNYGQNDFPVKDREKKSKKTKESAVVSDRIRENKLKTMESNCIIDDKKFEDFRYDHTNNLHLFDVSEQLPKDTDLESFTEWHKEIEDINWDDIKIEAKSKKPNNPNNIELDERKKKFENFTIPVQQPQTFEKMKKSFKNFIQKYYSSTTENEDVFKWRRDHKIIKSEIITPIVIKTLNSINKILDPIKISVPEDVKKVLENDALDISNVSNASPKHDKSGSNISDDQWNFPQKQIHLNLEKKIENQIEQEKNGELLIEEKDEITSDKNGVDDCICHATLKTNMLETFEKFKDVLVSSSVSENSILDSDDSDDKSVELSVKSSMSNCKIREDDLDDRSVELSVKSSMSNCKIREDDLDDRSVELSVKSSISNSEIQEDDLDDRSVELSVKSSMSNCKIREDDLDDRSVELSIKSSISNSEIQEDDLDNESVKSIKSSSSLNINEHQELSLVTKSSVPVFNDEDFSDESEMDFHFDDAFMNYLMCNSNLDISNNQINIQEVDSDDQKILGLSEK